MRRITTIALVSLSLLFAGCTAEASASGSQPDQGQLAKVAENLGKTLEGIDTKEAAEAAKAKISGLIDQLADALPKLGNEAAEKGGSLLEQAKKGAEALQSALSGNLTSALTKAGNEAKRLLDNPELAAPIKDLLTKLQNILPGGGK